MTLQLPWLVGSYDTGFIVAKEKGFYSQAGFDVTIQEGKGSAVTAELIAKGPAPFGVADASAVALLISKGLPVKMLAVYTQKSTNAFLYDKRHPFNTPKDLIGRPVVGTASSDSIELLPAVLSQYGVSKDKLHMDMIPPSAYAQVFVTHPDAVLIAQADNAGTSAMIADKPNGAYRPFADFGVNLYADGLVASNTTIAQHPDELKRFVTASNQGWEYAVQHQDEAISLVKKLFPQANTEVLAAGLAIDLSSLHTKATAGHPLGWMAKDDWSGMTSLLHRYGSMQQVLPPDSYYTDDFIPAS